MQRKLLLVLGGVAPALLVFSAACTHDFDSFVVLPGDASVDGGGSSGGEGGSSSGDGGTCGAPQNCLENAGACVIDCDKARDQCLANCKNNGCKQQCQNTSTQCRADCANTCASCSSKVGCNGTSDCTAATR